MLRLKKIFYIFTNSYFLLTFIRFGVVAAVEHISVIRSCRPETLLDVGANKGQFSIAFRSVQPNCEIYAFEPLDPAANIYQNVFRRDKNVNLSRTAISDRSGSAVFYVADRADSSSLLKLGSAQNEIFDVVQQAETTVSVEKLGAIVNLENAAHPIMLKIDVQGGEMMVLKGLEKIHLIDFIYIELSFIELYSNQPLFQDVSTFLADHGFTLRGVYNQFANVQHGAVQADFLFQRSAT